jgi:hypothetical protein
MYASKLYPSFNDRWMVIGGATRTDYSTYNILYAG